MIITVAAHRMNEAQWREFLRDRAGCIGKWMAFNLSDGSTDGTLYDTYRDVKRHNPLYCMYVRLHPDGPMSPRTAQVMLNFNRDLYDRGLRLGDPDAPHAEPTLKNMEL